MNSVTEVVFVLDRSGSMSGMESDTIGGFNGLLEKQKKEKGSAYITTVLFDQKYEILHDHLNINDVEKITEEDYYARGCTALLDAVGRTIEKMDGIVKHTKTNKVMFVIITDGYENASRQYSRRDIKGMVEARKEKGWEFIFLGANIDSFDEAESLGISRNRASNYHNDSKGVQTNFNAMCMMMGNMRKSQESLDDQAVEACLQSISEDYDSRA